MRHGLPTRASGVGGLAGVGARSHAGSPVCRRLPARLGHLCSPRASEDTGVTAAQPTHAPSDPAGGELYSGTSSDFMGSSAAFFRTWVHGAEQSYIRTEQNQDHWLHGRNGGHPWGPGSSPACLESLGPALAPELGGLGPSFLWRETLRKRLVGPMLQHTLSTRNGALPP